MLQTRVFLLSTVGAVFAILLCQCIDMGDNRSPEETIGATTQAASSGCPSTALGIYNVCASASGGAGTSTSPWTGWEASLNAVPAGGGGSAGSTGGGVDIYFPAGYYTLATGITLKSGWSVRGAGMDGTVIALASSFSGDALKLSYPVNTSNWANVRVEDLQLDDSTADTSTSNAGLDVIDGTYIYITRVMTNGFAYGIIFDAAEVSEIDECIIGNSRVGGIWLVNGSDHTPDQQGDFTNRIGIRRSQIDVTSIGIIDDGGATHVIDACNFEGGNPSILMSGVGVGTISNSEFEAETGPTIVTGFQTYHSKTGVGGDVNLTIANNSIPSGKYAGLSLGSSYEVILSNNAFSSSTTAVTGVSTVFEMAAFGNSQQGTGAVFDSDSTVGLYQTWTGFGVGAPSPTQAFQVNGGLRLSTATSQPTCSSSIDGTFWVVQGAPGAKDDVQVCAKDATNTYAWRVIY